MMDKDFTEQPAQPTVEIDMDEQYRALGVDENGNSLSPDQRKNPKE